MTRATGQLAVHLLLIACLAVAAAAALRWQMQQSNQAFARQRQQRSTAIALDAQSHALETLQLRASALAEDPAFVDYVAQSLQPNPMLGGAIDRASISDLLDSRRRGYDIAMVLDDQGAPAALDGVLLMSPGRIQHDALVARARTSHQPAQGIWVYDGKLLWVTVNPLMRGGSLRGLLLAARVADDSFTALVARHSGTAIGLLVSQRDGFVLAAQRGLPGWAVQSLPAALDALAPGPISPSGQYLALGGGHLPPAWRFPLDSSEGRVALVSLAEPVAAPGAVAAQRRLDLAIAGLAALGLLLALGRWMRQRRL